MIDRHFKQVQSLLDRYGATLFVLDISVTFNRRPGEQGYVTGKVTFADGSLLSFREFLDTTLGVLDKLMYS